MPVPVPSNPLPAIGQIKRFLSIPCSVPPSIWFETAVPAAMDVIWSFAQPDPKFLHELAFGHSFQCGLEMALKDAAEGTPIGDSAGVKFLFEATAWIDRSVWFAFLASIVGEGLFDWASSVYKMVGCQHPGELHDGTQPIGACGDEGNWARADGFAWVYGDPVTGPYSFPHLQVYPGQSYIIAVHCTAHDLNFIPMALDTRIRQTENGLILDEGSYDPNVAGGDTQAITFHSGKNQAGEIMTVQWEAICPGPADLHEVFPNLSSKAYWRVE